MQGNAIRCLPGSHKYRVNNDRPKRGARCSTCGFRLQCERGKHRFPKGERIKAHAVCIYCGKGIARRRRDPNHEFYNPGVH